MEVLITSYEEVCFINRFFANINLSPLYLGLGGRGKTAMQSAYAKEIGKPFISVAMSTYTTPASIIGKMQRPDRNGNLVWADMVPDWFPCYRWDLEKGEEVMTTDETKGFEPVYDKNGRVKSHPAVILFDEINQIDFSVQGWLLTAILSRVIANQKICDEVEFIAAANPKEGSYRQCVKALNPSLGDSAMGRFITFRYEPTAKTWGLLQNKKLQKADKIAFPKLGYYSKGSDLFIAQNNDIRFHPDAEDTCFRSCTEFFNGLGEVDNISKYPTIYKIAQAVIGNGNADVLLQYTKDLTKWNGKDILSGKQRINDWFELAEASDAIIAYLRYVDGKLSKEELKILTLLINYKWRGTSETLISIKEVCRFFNEIYNESAIDSLEIKNLITALGAKAIAGKAKVLG